MSPRRREPLQLRALWWLMLRAERVAGWCRARWLKWHETGGVVLPTENTPTDGGKNVR